MSTWGRDINEEIKEERKEVDKLSKKFNLSETGKWTSSLTRLYESKNLTYKYADKTKIEEYVVKWQPILNKLNCNIKDAAYIFECEAINLNNYQTKFKKLPFMLRQHFPALRKYLDSR